MNPTTHPPKSISDEAEKAAKDYDDGAWRIAPYKETNLDEAYLAGVRWLWQFLLERGQAEELTDEDYNRIEDDAVKSLRKFSRGVRGQMIYRHDNLTAHIIDVSRQQSAAQIAALKLANEALEAKLAEANELKRDFMKSEQAALRYLDIEVNKCKALEAENARYRAEMDKMNAGIPSEWAYKILERERDRYREALQFYAAKGNWQYTGMYNKRDATKYIEGPNCDWADHHKNITNDDLEEHTPTIYFGGKRARAALAVQHPTPPAAGEAEDGGER